MAKTKILGSQINLDSLTAAVHALTSKSTPADGDEVPLVDSAASYTAKRLSWSNIKAALASYFDALYAPATGWVPAGENWIYNSADPPEFTFKISGDLRSKYQPGDRIKLTQSGNTKYFIVTKVEYSSPYTIVTIYGGTNYVLAAASITNPYYSKMKSPQGFPLDPELWSITYINYDMYFGQTSMVEGQWYYTGISISLPAGSWKVWYKVLVDSSDLIQVALSTNPSSSEPTHPELAHSSLDEYAPVYYQTQGYMTLTSRTTCYLLVRVPSSYNDSRIVDMYADSAFPLIIKATCAYL